MTMAVDDTTDSGDSDSPYAGVSGGDEVQVWAGAFGKAGDGDPRSPLAQALVETEAADRGVRVDVIPGPEAVEATTTGLDVDEQHRGAVRETFRTVRDVFADPRCEADGDWYCYQDTPTVKRYRRPSTAPWDCRVHLISAGVTHAWHVRVSGEVPSPFTARSFETPPDEPLDYEAAQTYATSLLSWLAEYHFVEARDDYDDGPR